MSYTEHQSRDDEVFNAHKRRTGAGQADIVVSRHNVEGVQGSEPLTIVRELLICPQPDRDEPSAPIAPIGVETIFDLMRVVMEGGSMVAVNNPRVLDFIHEFSPELGVTPIVLTGFPTATYSAIWEQKTFGYDRIAYDTLVAEVVTTARVESLNSKDAGANGRLSESAKRQERATRPLKDLAIPSKKPFTDFETHVLGTPEEPVDVDMGS